MELRNKKTMDFKKLLTKQLLISLIWTSTISSSRASELAVQLPHKAPRDCEKITHRFLGELRSIAPDVTITVDVIEHQKVGSSAQKITLQCTGLNTLTVNFSALESKQDFIFRYLDSHDTFQAEDWIPFQQMVFSKLEPSNSQPPVDSDLNQLRDVAPTYSAVEKTNPSLLQTTTPTEVAANESGLLKKWWFWSLVAVAGGGTYWVVKNQSRATSATIQVR
ncbi:MAG TPA: hypothetical protein PLH57_10370 [Oligoflexia bacterium]|nr:hypothetical protein [Oligoflexia bacterium]